MPPRETCSTGLRVREYNPSGSAQSKPIGPEEWQKHEDLIRALHGAKYTRAEVLQTLGADCGCAQKCSFSPSPHQYSAQLKLWGLRTYKIKGGVLANPEHARLNIPPHGQEETTPVTPPRQVNAEQGSPMRGLHLERMPVPRYTSGNHLASENVGGSGVRDDPKHCSIDGSHPGSQHVRTPPHLDQQNDDGGQLKSSPPPPWGTSSCQRAETTSPSFGPPDTVEDAVNRLVLALSEVLADPELEQFLDNLTDPELEELLFNPLKLKDACDNASTGEFCSPQRTGLVQIRDTLANRARHLYCSNPKAASLNSDQPAMALTTSSSEKSPATWDGDNLERSPIAHIHDEDTEMQEYLNVINASNVHDCDNSANMAKNGPLSCSACVDIPNVEYKVSANASQLWSELSSRQDSHKALDEIHMLACCFFAAQSYGDAFDLYFIIWNESESSSLLNYRFAAAFDCARSSATPQQDVCVEAVLHHLLTVFEKNALRTPLNLFQRHMLHCFLGDLYVKLREDRSAETHIGKAMMLIEYNSRPGILEPRYRDNCHLSAALESQMADMQRHVSKAIGYNASTVSIDQFSKDFATEIQDNALLENLLPWCAEVVKDNSRGIDAFGSVLPKHPIEQRGFICRTLFCYLVERWLDESRRSSSAKKATHKRGPLRLKDVVSTPEALSAIAMLVSHDCPDLSRPHAPLGRGPYSWILSSTLLKNITQLIKLKSSDRSFSEIYLSLLAASGEVRKQPLDEKPRKMLWQFMMNIATTNLLDRHPPLRGIGLINTLVPSPDLLREHEIRRASWSNRLYSPRSSFSSGLNSIRATATKSMMNSVHFLANRQSAASVTAMSTTSYRSSWSFGAVTGFPRAPSVLSDQEMMDGDMGTSHEEPQDAEMADIR